MNRSTFCLALYPFWGLCCSILQCSGSKIHPAVLMFPKVSDRLLSSTILNLILSADLLSSTTHQHALHLARDVTVTFLPAILLTNCCFQHCSTCLCLCHSFLCLLCLLCTFHFLCLLTTTSLRPLSFWPLPFDFHLLNASTSIGSSLLVCLLLSLIVADCFVLL